MIRRKLLHTLSHFNERTDRAAAFLTAVFVLMQVVPLPHLVTELGHTALATIETVVAALILTYLALRFFLLRNPNRRWSFVLTDDECRSLRKWVTAAVDHPLLEDVDCRVRFATQADLETLAELNFAAFLDTAYESDRKTFERRNGAFIRRNPRSFLLMVDPIGGKDLIGYSCVLPLTRLGTDLYVEGSIADASMNAELICPPTEKPTSVLIFAIHLRDEYGFQKSGASRKYSLYFWSCIRAHFKAVLSEHFSDGETVDVYAQTQEPALERRLKKIGFVETEHETRDGCALFRMQTTVGFGRTSADERWSDQGG